MSLMKEAQALIVEGGLLYDKGNMEESMKVYRQAWDILPDAPMAAEARMMARDGYSRAANAHARKLASAARYSEAQETLKSILAEDFDPDNAEAKKFTAQLGDPERFEPALTPEHLKQVDEVTKILREANGQLSLAEFDKANESFQRVLRIDATNSAARRGMERVEQEKSRYYATAYDHTRAKRLAEVDKEWEDSVPKVDLSALFGGSAGTGAVAIGLKENAIIKLRKLIIPLVDLDGASLEEVVEFLRVRSRELDSQKRGVDIVLKASPELRAKTVTINMNMVPFEEVLRYVTEMTGTVYRVDDFAVTISSHSEQSTAITSKSYRVPPDFIQNAPAGDAGAAAPLDPFAPAGAAPAKGLTIRRLGAKEFLESRGVAFPEGSAASYNPSTNILFVRNISENLAMIDALVEQVASSAPKQVEIQVKLIEVNETRLKELGFDWLLGQFNVPGSDRIYTGGGTVGNQRGGPFTNQEFPIDYPNGTPVGGNPLTSGLRSSGSILGRPSIDALINRISVLPLDSRSPGAFAVSGVFTDPQFQVVMRAINQSKGIDVMASPTIVTKSGQRASVTVSREFRYPTEFDPPQIPQNTGGNNVNGGGGGIGGGGLLPAAAVSVPAIPATPTAFDKRDVGFSLEVEPVVGENGKTVELNIVPSSVEFEGFIDYGTDFTQAGPTPLIVDNKILQPVFRTNKVTTSVSVWDGNTVILGGVMLETSQKIQDKVPVLGNLPLVGRAFQSQVSNVERKNVIFMVTVRVIDPSGSRVNQPVVTPETAGQ
ncbi:hypothetical protein BH11VER1_BH11VER1_27980 [soil metagenome]